MYTIRYGEHWLHDPIDHNYVVYDVKMSGSANASPALDFTIARTHPNRKKLNLRDLKNAVEVYNNQELLFRGYITDFNEALDTSTQCSCISEMSYLNDIQIRPYETIIGISGSTAHMTKAPSTIGALFEWYVNQYNARCGSDRIIAIGKNEGDSIAPGETVVAYSDTASSAANEITSKLLDIYGGYIYMSYPGGVRTINYMAETVDVNDQMVDFGVNLLDYNDTTTTDGMYTACRAVGVDDIDLTSLPNKTYEKDPLYVKNGDIVYNAEAVKKYGMIEEEWKSDSIEKPELLLDAAVRRLRVLSEPQITLEVRAIDLSLLYEDYQSLTVGQFLRVRSVMNGLDRYLVVSDMDIDISNAENTSYTLGVPYNTFTGQQSSLALYLNNNIYSQADRITSMNFAVKKKSRVYVGGAEPVGEDFNENDIWIDTSNDNQRLYYSATNVWTPSLIGTDAIHDGAITSLKIKDAAITTAKIQEASITEAKIKDAEITTAKIHDAAITNAKIGELAVNNTNIQNATIEFAKMAEAFVGDLVVNNEYVENLEAVSADIFDAKIGTAEIGQAQIKDLETDYAKINLANVNNAWIENGVIKNAAIKDEQVISVSANKLTAGTIDASKITVTNLNADNLTVGTINGERIGNASIDLSKLSEEVPTKEYLDDVAENLQGQIDGQIESWTSTSVPTLNNYPASNWTDATTRKTHVGDVLYVVNTASEADGYCYRFTESETGAFSWVLIKDSDVTKALQELIDVKGDVSGLKTFESTTSSWITNTNSELSSIKSKQTTLETDLGNKVENSTFNTLKQTVEENTASITSLGETVSTKADGSTVQTLSNTVNTVSQKANSNESKISTLETTTSSQGTRLTSAETAISQNTEAISLRVTKGELDDAVSSKVDAEAALNIAKNAITSTVWDAELGSSTGVTQTATGFKITVKQSDVTGPKGSDGTRGTSIYTVTTAPSSYTTVTGGFTPTYRMSLSTALTQSGAKSILVGDNIRYSYYLYPVGYVDSSYVYTGARTSIRGATGAAGATPVKGTDYFTDSEISSIQSNAATAAANSIQIGGRNLFEKTNTEYGYAFNIGNQYKQPAKEFVTWLGVKAVKYTSLELNTSYTTNWKVFEYVDNGQVRKKIIPGESYVFSYDCTIGDTASPNLTETNSRNPIFNNATSSITQLVDENGETYYHHVYYVEAKDSFEQTSQVGYNLVNITAFLNSGGNVMKFANLKLEKGNKATDWTPAPEDVDNNISTSVETFTTLVDTTTTEVKEMIGSKVDIADFTPLQTSVSGFGQQITEAKEKAASDLADVSGKIQTQLNNLGDEYSEKAKKIDKYLAFEEDGLTIGASGAKAKVRIDNEQVSFIDGEQIVAYVNGQMLYIANEQILDNLRFGNFVFSERKGTQYAVAPNMLNDQFVKNRNRTSTEYHCGQYNVNTNVVAGEIYTWSVNVNITGTKKGLAFYFGGGTHIAGNWVTNSSGLASGTYSMTFTATSNQAAATFINVYCSNNAGGQGSTAVSGTCVINWVKLENGNKATDVYSHNMGLKWVNS